MSDVEGMGAAGVSAEDLAKLEQSIAENVRLALAGDWEEFARLYAEDVLMMPPNASASVGREAILGMFSGVTITAFTSRLLHAESQGDLAWGHGEHSWTMEIDGDPKPVSDSGKWLAVWRRGSDGRWLLAADIWNSSQGPGE